MCESTALGPVRVGDVVVARPDLDRQVREQPELVVAPGRDLALVEEVRAARRCRARRRGRTGRPGTACRPSAGPGAASPALPGRARRQRRRPRHRGEHVGREHVVVVRVDRRHHLLGLRHVGVDEAAVHVRRVVPLAHRVDRELPVAVDAGGEAVALGHQLERVGLELEDPLAEERRAAAPGPPPGSRRRTRRTPRSAPSACRSEPLSRSKNSSSLVTWVTHPSRP